jgi:hypothetical protein
MPQDLFSLPSPKSYSIAGNLTDFGEDPLAFLTSSRESTPAEIAEQFLAQMA